MVPRDRKKSPQYSLSKVPYILDVPGMQLKREDIVFRLFLWLKDEVFGD